MSIKCAWEGCGKTLYPSGDKEPEVYAPSSEWSHAWNALKNAREFFCKEHTQERAEHIWAVMPRESNYTRPA